MRYFSEANGCSTVDRRNRIISAWRAAACVAEPIVKVTVHEPLRSIGAARFHRTRATHCRVTRINDSRLVPLQLFACERPIGWAAIGVGLLVVSELVAVE